MQGCFRIVIIIIIVIVIIIIIIIVITPCSGLDFALLTARLESLVFLWPCLKVGRRALRARRASTEGDLNLELKKAGSMGLKGRALRACHAHLSLKGMRPFPGA